MQCKIIKLDTTWSIKHKFFKDVVVDENLNADNFSSKKPMVRYNVSIFPTFLALDKNNNLVGKLENPSSVEDFNEWITILKNK